MANIFLLLKSYADTLSEFIFLRVSRKVQLLLSRGTRNVFIELQAETFRNTIYYENTCNSMLMKRMTRNYDS